MSDLAFFIPSFTARGEYRAQPRAETNQFGGVDCPDGTLPEGEQYMHNERCMESVDEKLTVSGLSSLQRSHGHEGQQLPWRPGQPEPESLELDIGYCGNQYHAAMARTEEGARSLGMLDEMRRWMRTHDGWWVRVWGPAGSHFSASHATLEAALVVALLLPPFIHARHELSERKPDA